MSKKKTRDEQIENVKANLDDAKAARRAIVANQKAIQGKGQKASYVSFQEWWATQRKSYGKSKDLEDIIWPHLKAIGCDSPEKFEEGVKHFGLSKVN
jgi:hypothetical protein